MRGPSGGSKGRRGDQGQQGEGYVESDVDFQKEKKKR